MTREVWHCVRWREGLWHGVAASGGSLLKHPFNPLRSIGGTASSFPLKRLASSDLWHVEGSSSRFSLCRRFSSSSLRPEGSKADDNSARERQTVGESDWRSHAAAIAKSLELIKARLEWKKVLCKIKQLDAQLESSDLWQDPEQAAHYMREHGAATSRIKSVKDIESELLDNVCLAELAHEEHDTEAQVEATNALANLRKVAKEREVAALLSGDHDTCSCFIEVQAGAGGTESMDWAAMLVRMYKMWAQNHGFNVTVVDEMLGEVAGIKRSTIRLDGEFAYGYAKTEAGVHRLVRISPFDSGKRRHTSFAAVAVIPLSDDGRSQVHINEGDLRIERFCSGGPGGQHANKTESAVRIVHLPTGITAQSHAERSQHQNKQQAMSVLQARLQQMEMIKRSQENSQHTQALGEISWGNQIRSYVLQPYQMVKDLRTNYEVSDPVSVLDGDLDGFILSVLANYSTIHSNS